MSATPADLSAPLAALEAALAAQDASAIGDAAAALQTALSHLAARPAPTPRQAGAERSAWLQLGAQVAGQREAVSRARAMLDISAAALLPAVHADVLSATYGAMGLPERTRSLGHVSA